MRLAIEELEGAQSLKDAQGNINDKARGQMR